VYGRLPALLALVIFIFIQRQLIAGLVEGVVKEYGEGGR
jgi:hypothetical protein